MLGEKFYFFEMYSIQWTENTDWKLLPLRVSTVFNLASANKATVNY